MTPYGRCLNNILERFRKPTESFERIRHGGLNFSVARNFVMETRGIHIKKGADADYKRSVFSLCSEHARKTDWAEFVPAMRKTIMRFEIVDEDEWEKRLNAMFTV